MTSKRRNIVEPLPCREPAIGPWLWAMQDARQRTMEELEGVTPEMVDWVPPEGGSSIGTVLYHIADIEADWLYVEVLETELPADMKALFPYPTRDGTGQLTQVHGIDLEAHLDRLERVRDRLLETFVSMDLEDYRRERSLPHYDVTPEWVLHHLLQHEAEHRSQIGSLRNRAKEVFHTSS